MHPVFRSIFQRQFRAYRVLQTDGKAPDWEDDHLLESARRSMLIVEDALDAAASAVGPDFRLRPDAKLLLAVNLHQLVALPLMLAREDEHAMREIEPPRPIEQTVHEDAQTIARAAREVAKEGEITAADVARGLPRVLDELHLKDWRLWDRA